MINIIKCQIMAACGERVFSYEPRKMAISSVWRSEERSRLHCWEKHHINIITYWKKSYRSTHHCMKLIQVKQQKIYHHGEPTTAMLHSNSLMIQHERSRMSVQRLPHVSSIQNASSHQQFSTEFCFFLTLKWLIFKKFLCQNIEITSCLFELITIPLWYP